MTCLSKSLASTSYSSQVKTSRNWLDLPPELTSLIFMRVGSIDLLISVRKVCKLWRRICYDPAIWRVVDISSMTNLYYFYRRIEYKAIMDKMARQAVSLSSGQMIDFTVHHVGSDDLLSFVSDRARELKCLRLVSCFRITDEGVSEMVKKLPLLEELHLYHVPISKKAIEVVGCCCPLLKSFKYSRQILFYSPYECDEVALAIAQNMPGLRHLQLLGNQITSDSLLAILENCLHLKSLDLRGSFNFVRLEPDLERRLSEKMKNLSLTYDYTEAYDLQASEYSVDYASEGSDDSEDYSVDYSLGHFHAFNS